MRPGGFIARSTQAVVLAMAHAMDAEELAKESGLLQRLDPRVKMVGLTGLIIAAAVSRTISVIGCIFAGAIVLSVLSRVPASLLAKRVWIPILLFTAVIATPALFTTPGQPLATFPFTTLIVTEQGSRAAAYLVARTETAATLALLLVLCTPWTHLLKALRSFRLPVTLVVILGMTHRYIYLLLDTARDMFDSRKSRTVGVLTPAEQRRIATRTAGVLMDKSLRLSNDVYLAMRSRGFTGEVRTLSEFKMKAADYLALGVSASLCAAAFWAGR